MQSVQSGQEEARRLGARAPELLAQLQIITGSLSRALTVTDVADAAVEHSVDALGASAGLIALAAEQSDSLEVVASRGYPPEVMARWEQIPLDSPLPITQAVRTGEPVFLWSVAERDELYPALASEPTENRAFAVVPLRIEDRSLGALALSFAEPRALADVDRSFLLAMTQHAAVAIERARLYESERAARRDAERAQARLRFLAQASALLASSLELSTNMEQLARLAIPYMADWCIVTLVDGDGRARRVAVEQADPERDNTAEAIRAFPIDLARPSGTSRVIRGRTAEFQPEATASMVAEDADDPASLEEVLGPLGIQSWMCVPMWRRGRTLGAISFISTQESRRYTYGDLELAEDVARSAAMAIDNARLLQSERRERRESEEGRDRLSLLSEVSVILAESLDITVTLRRLVELAVRNLADWCAIDLVVDDNTIDRLAVAHRDPSMRDIAREFRRRYPVDPGQMTGAQSVIRTGQPELYPVVGEELIRTSARDDEQAALIRRLGVRSALVVPLRARGRILGALTLLSTDTDRRYDDDDLRFAELVARRAAVAVDNARLYAESVAAERQYRSLVNNVEAIVWDADPGTLQMSFVSDRAERILGYPSKDWLEPDFWSRVLHPEDAESVLRTAAESIEAANDFEIEYRAIASDGRVVWLRTIARVECDADATPSRVRGITLDVTFRRRAEERLRAQHAVAAALSQARTLSSGIKDVLEAIGESLRWDVGTMWTFDEANGVLRASAQWRRSAPQLDAFVQESAQAAFPPGVGLAGRVWESSEPAWIRDIAVENFPRSQAAAASDVHGGFGFPIRVRGRLYGVMEVFSRRVQEPDPELLETTRTIGRQLGQFIQRMSAEEELRFQKLLLESQSEATIDGILVVSPEGRILFHNQRFVEMWGIPPDVLNKESDASAIDAVVDRVEDPEQFSARVRWLYENPNESARDEVRLKDGRVFDRWTAPLTAEGEAYGRAWYFRDVSAERHLEHRLAENERRSGFLADVSAVLAEAQDDRILFQRLADALVPFLGDWCIVDLVHPDGNVDRVAVAHGDPAMVELAQRVSVRRHYQVDPNAPGGVPKVLRTGRRDYALEIPESWIDRVAGESEYLEQLKSLGFRSYICVPLLIRDAVQGAVTIVTADSGRSFSKADVDLAEEIARRASLALENIRLLRERSHIARTLQEGLLPPQLPLIPGLELAARYRAAGEGNEVGGDFYDVFPSRPNGWALVIGDVCGKGAEAAALTALVRYTIRTLAMQVRKPRRILARLNEAILSQRTDGRFCTLAYARIDPTPGGFSVKLASAGHPLPILIRGTGEASAIGRHGSLLGIFPDATSTEEAVELGPGDAMVFFTDGVPEARSALDVFGDERLQGLVASSAGRPAAEIANLIEESVMNFQEGFQRDDIAILVLRVSDRLGEAETSSGG